MAPKRLLRTAASLILLGFLVVVPNSPAFAAGTPFYFVGHASSKCIDDPKNSTADNTVMIIYTCLRGATNQYWSETVADTSAGTQYLWLVNGKSGKCLTVKNASLSQNEPIIQYTCNHGANEEWYVYDFDSAYGYMFANRNSDKCVTVKNAAVVNNSTLLQYTCNYGENQWFFETQPEVLFP
jgi:hypothetical protein